jgi:hypothetical protein
MNAMRIRGLGEAGNGQLRNFETQCMSAKRAALVTAPRTEHLEYENLGILTARGQVFKGAPIDELLASQ